jgi:UDP-N-acetylglucosamine transferase subunit ALG13
VGNLERNISRWSVWRKYILIFVTTGSRAFQFDRLIKKLDELVADGTITDHVIAQIGATTYEAKNLECYPFLDTEQFKAYQDKATLIISHAGTGALIGALKKEKNVISVPRLFKYGEHSDDHQTQISSVLAGEGYLREVLDMDKLGETILEALEHPITKKYNRPSNIISLIETFIDENEEKR